ncbi:MAG: hypothetical protein HY790_01615 [Deltaproteobacteria bacterium]|nr:hypothetical protein [Deltaproteobacteria bacterium]
MKQETLNTLMVARTLFDKAQKLCSVDDKFLASAGIVVLQDALELVLYSCLEIIMRRQEVLLISYLLTPLAKNSQE